MPGRTPLPNQYSGRHISHWKMNNVYVDRSAPGVTGKIQFGADPGASAQVIVPACAVPLADGTEPNAPDVVFTDPLEGVLLQAPTPRARFPVVGGSQASRAILSPGWHPCRTSVVVPGLGAVEASRPLSVVTNFVQRPPPWRGLT